MNKIDITNWKDFRISDLFETEKVGNKLQVPTGANIEKKYLSENGSIPRITVTGFNNGVSGYFDCTIDTPNYRMYENFISVSFLGTVFYHAYKASLDMKVHCLKLKNIILDKYTGQFLVAAIKVSLKESTYADQISSTVLPTLVIKLPTHKMFSPDFDKLQYVVEGGVDVDMTKIDTSTWKEFTLKDLGFSFYHGARLKKTDRIEGDIPFVTAGKENKGIIGKLGNKDISVYHNPITIDMFGNCFYHDFDCAGDDNIYFFVNDNLDNKVKIYISSVINSKIRDLYSYTDQFRQDDAENLTVLLPVKECVEPDFDYMKQYMKDIENRVSVSLTALQEVQGKNKIIDIKEWQSFHLYDIFDIDSGSKLDKVDMNTTKAEINFVGRSNFNNGITEKVKEIEGLKPYEAGNLTLALGGAYLGSCFVQKEKFYTSQNVVVLRPKSAISDYSKQFIATAIFKESQNNYKAFINELNSHIKTDFQIKLPVKTDGSPDYDYMDKYIESVYGGGDTRSQHIDSDYMICGWKEYKMKDFFTISRGQRFVKAEHEPGDIPYYSASNENNGVTDYISNPLFIEENALVYTTFGDCFYAEGEFTASDEISILKYPEINKYNALFIAGIVNSNKYKYEFKQKAFKKAFENDVIKLPIGINGLPNFKYMEQYIKNMEVKQKDKLNKLQEIQD